MKLKYVQHKKLYRLTPLNEEIKKVGWLIYKKGNGLEIGEIEDYLEKVMDLESYLLGLKTAKELIKFKE